MDSDPLDLDVRRLIFETVRNFPGLHFRELQRQLEDMPGGQLEYHLDFLKKHDIVNTQEDRYYLRFFPSKMDRREAKIMSSLRQENPRRIVMHLIESPGTTHKGLMEAFGFKASTLSMYLKDMTGKCIIVKVKDGRENLYRVADVQKVVELLLVYRKSFLDKLVDRFLEAFLEG
jgi:predicted transcriptional regulator